MLKTKGNPRNVNFVLGNPHLVKGYHMLMSGSATQIFRKILFEVSKHFDISLFLLQVLCTWTIFKFNNLKT
jgi:hypothetical protein